MNFVHHRMVTRFHSILEIFSHLLPLGCQSTQPRVDRIASKLRQTSGCCYLDIASKIDLFVKLIEQLGEQSLLLLCLDNLCRSLEVRLVEWSCIGANARY